MVRRRHILVGAAALALSWGVGLASWAQAQALTIYSGRGESLIGPLIQQAEEALGFDINVRYGDTAELAIAIIEEGRNSPADLFFGQDAGALGALADARRTRPIPARLLVQVDRRFRSPSAQWLGITGRARVVAYNTDRVSAAELPASIWELTEPQWRGRVGWAPTNGSFQSFITAMRLLEGEERTLEWLEAMRDNGVVEYRNNTAIVEAIGRGEIDAGITNNYYLYRFLAEDPNFPVAHHYTRGDVGALVNIAGVAIINTTDSRTEAEQFIEFLLSDQAQNFFAEVTKEYPLVQGMEPPEEQLSLDEINPPDIDLTDLADLQGTLALLQRAGIL